MGEIFHEITERDILHMTPMNYIKYLNDLHSAYSDAFRKSDALTTERNALRDENNVLRLGAAPLRVTAEQVTEFARDYELEISNNFDDHGGDVAAEMATRSLLTKLGVEVTE